MIDIQGTLAELGIPCWDTAFSALDAFHGLSTPPLRFMALRGGMVELARLDAGMAFSGLSYADGSLDTGKGIIRFRCIGEDFRGDDPQAFPHLDLFRLPGTLRFADPRGVYSLLREGRLPAARGDDSLFATAVMVSRYGYETDALAPCPRIMPAEAQRDLLTLVLTAPKPERGLELLRRAGFLAAHWPELAALPGTSQSKEYHPEGDAWDHTLETFQYRKLPGGEFSLALSLALLLHDTGKPQAASSGGRRFDRHSEIGTTMARRFMSRLGFGNELIDTVTFLVRWHMLPAALPRLPTMRALEPLEDPRFPLLLELYRCDELSTFRGPDGYHLACAAYHDWQRNRKNPYRDDEGRKLARMYIESLPPTIAMAGRVRAQAKGRKR